MTTRMFRGGDFERARARSSDFDPVIEGQKHQLGPEVSLAIWERVRAEVTDSDGEPDEPRAQERFHQVARRVAARRGQLGPVPGRVTRVEAEAWGSDPDGDVFADVSPGRTTRVMDAARRWERQMAGTEAAPDRTELLHQREVEALRASLSSEARGRAGAPSLAGALGWVDTKNATLPAALGVDAPRPGLAKAPTASRPGETTTLDASVGARMSRLFGVDLTRVAVVPASPAATGATKAVTRDQSSPASHATQIAAFSPSKGAHSIVSRLARTPSTYRSRTSRSTSRGPSGRRPSGSPCSRFAQ